MTGLQCPECGTFEITRIKELREDSLRKYQCESGHAFELTKKQRQAIAPACVKNIKESEPDKPEYRKCKICGQNNISTDRKFVVCLDCFMLKLVHARSLKDFKASLL